MYNMSERSAAEGMLLLGSNRQAYINSKVSKGARVAYRFAAPHGTIGGTITCKRNKIAYSSTAKKTICKPIIYWIRVHWDDGDTRTLVRLGAHTYTESEPKHTGEWTFMARKNINKSPSIDLISSGQQALSHERKSQVHQRIDQTPLKTKYRVCTCNRGTKDYQEEKGTKKEMVIQDMVC